jgi:type I restriction enzyme S subunit
VIRLQNIGDGEFIDAESHISQSHFERLRAHEAAAGDVVVASLGDALPRACVVPGSLGPAIVKADCARIRVGDLVRADYLSVALNSPPVRRQAAGLIAGIGRQRLSLRKLKELKIPTPPVDEQDRLLERLQRQMKGVTSVRTAIKDSGATVEDLRRSLFLRAFTGQLRTDEGSESRRMVVR